MRNLNLVLKRFFDIMASVIGLIIIAPILLLIPILIEITMPGPVFFKQQRVGKKGRLFNVFKFRSMKVDQIAESEKDFSKDAERLTSFGKLIQP